MHTIWKFVESWPQDMIYVYIYSHRNIKWNGLARVTREKLHGQSRKCGENYLFLGLKTFKTLNSYSQDMKQTERGLQLRKLHKCTWPFPPCLQQRPKTCFCSTIPGVFQLHWGEGVFWWFCCWQEMWHRPMFKLAVTLVKWHKTQWKKYLATNIQWKCSRFSSSIG